MKLTRMGNWPTEEEVKRKGIKQVMSVDDLPPSNLPRLMPKHRNSFRNFRGMTGGSILFSHPKRTEIDQDLMLGMSVNAVSKKYKMQYGTIKRYYRRFIRPRMMRLVELRKAVEDRDTKNMLNRIYDEAMETAREARKKEEYAAVSKLLANATNAVTVGAEVKKEIRCGGEQSASPLTQIGTIVMLPKLGDRWEDIEKVKTALLPEGGTD